MLGVHIFIIAISSWIDLYIIMYCPSLSLFMAFMSKSISSDLSIFTPAFLVSICMKYLFQPFTFRLYVTLVLRWVSHRQHI